jgi:hypothetical protein
MDKIEIEVDVRSDGDHHRVDLEVANYRSDEVVVRLAHPLPEGFAPSAVAPLSGSLADSWSVSEDGLAFAHEVDWASAIKTGYVAQDVDRAAIEAAFEEATVTVQEPGGHAVGTLSGIEPRFTDAVSIGPAGDPGNDGAVLADDADRRGPEPPREDGTGSADAEREDGPDAGFDADQPWETLGRHDASTDSATGSRDGEPAILSEDGGSTRGHGRDEDSLPANVSAYVLDGLPDELPEGEFFWKELDDGAPSTRPESEGTESGDGEPSTRPESDGTGPDDGEPSTRPGSERTDAGGEEPSTQPESGGLLERVRSWF